MNNIDNGINNSISNWKFDKNVSDVFDSHAVKSIPLYDTFHDLTMKICDWYIYNGCRIVDIGTSTGKFIKNLTDRHKDKELNFIAIDISEDMLSKAKEKIGTINGNVNYICEDACEIKVDDKVDIVVCLFTLQFLTLESKKELIKTIYQMLKKGGLFILADKYINPNSHINNIFSQLYEDFKLDNGLSLDNVYNKKISLRGVQHNEVTYIDLMKKEGFQEIYEFARYLNFQGYFSIK